MTKTKIKHTCLLWSAVPELLSISKKVAKSNGFQIIALDNEIDLVAHPSFIQIIDAPNLMRLIKFLGKDLEDYFHWMDERIVIYGDLKKEMPSYISDKLIQLPYVLSQKRLEAIILPEYKKYCKEIELRRTLYKSRLFRTVYLINMLQNNISIELDKLEDKFNCSERTLRRDLETVRTIFPAIDVWFNNEGMVSAMRKSRKTKIAPPNKRQVVFENSVKRISKLITIAAEAGVIKKQKFCAAHKITERTFRRDLVILRSLDPKVKVNLQ